MATHDLHITAGRVVCPNTGFDGPGGVAISEGKIAFTGLTLSGKAHVELEYPDASLFPGLVDLHAHPARGHSKYGIDPDHNYLPRGTTTVMSQGDAGAANWSEYQKNVIHASKTRVQMALNLSRSGESTNEGCFSRIDDIDVEACIKAIEKDGANIWGIAVNIASSCCGDTDPHEVMRRALEAAEGGGVPLLFGPRSPVDWPLEEQLALLRPGDVITYCFRPDDCRILDENMHVLKAVRNARERGILFDAAHGMNSFSFPIAEAAITDGFLPDTISTDQYKRHVGLQPQHDLPRTISKLIAAGMPQQEAFSAATVRPAEILGLDENAGSLALGTSADLAILEFNEEAPPLRDVKGIERPGGCWEPVVTIRAGELIWPS